MKNSTFYPPKLEKWANKLKRLKLPAKWVWVLMGIASTIWFLVRVIPKPTRAGYPCMQAAAPVMSSFVVYLLSLTGATLAFKKAGSRLGNAKLVSGIAFLVAGIAFAIVFTFRETRESNAAILLAPDTDFPANQPMGTGIGVNPGRVVWAWDPDATNENCTNVLPNDGYYLAKNVSQTVVNDLFAQSVQKLAGKTSGAEAWTALFTNFNQRKGKGAVSYKTTETIFIKINMGCGGWATKSDLTRQSWALGYSETSPAIIIACLKELIEVAGVPQNKIIIADPIAHIYEDVYTQLKALYPNVKYGDKGYMGNGSSITASRTTLTKSTTKSMYWSDRGEQLGAPAHSLYVEMENADYMINLAALKAHARAGVTLCAKNNFGSFTFDGATELHPGLIAPENDVPERTDYNTYRVQVDIMGHKKLGQNTLLFVVDGLWGGPEATDVVYKWKSAPFNDDWPSSIFMSQDQVALESVCFDFLRYEYNGAVGDKGKGRPLMGGVDDYLHQAADQANWPTELDNGTPFDGYDPEDDGTVIGSLGTHEHWNSPSLKQYSRNLGLNTGIELAKVGDAIKVSVDNVVNNAFNLSLSPVPVSDVLTVAIDDDKLNGSVFIAIYSVNGSVVYQKTFANEQGTFNQQIGLEQLTSGIYLVEVSTNSGKVVKRIAKK